MGAHQAVEQMLGYLYQVRYALLLLLQNDDEQAQICIEKFDDIAFSHDDNNSERMIQLKHHTKAYGDLTDGSTDIWRTIKVWADLVYKDATCLTRTKFIIITTAIAPEKSAASYLKPITNELGRDARVAFSLLKEITKTSKNIKHESYYKLFNKLGDER